MVYTEWGFDSSLLPSLESIKERISINKAALIIIDGGVGEGKTTLAAEIAEWYQPGWLERMEDLLAIGGKDFTKKLEQASKKKDKVVVYDEGGDFASRQALTRFNQGLNRVFETYRSTQILVILCLPCFIDLDNSLMKKSIARLLLHVYGRTKTYGRIKLFSLWRMYYLREKMKEITVAPQAYSFQTPNVRGLFKDLPEEYRKKLEKISNKGKSNIRKQTYKKQEGLIDSLEVAEKLGIKRSTFFAARERYPFKAVEKVGNKKYFRESDVDNYIDNKASSSN